MPQAYFFLGLTPHSGESPLEGKVPNEVRRMRWRRAESYTKPAPSSVACGDSFPQGEASDSLRRTKAFRPFCLLRLPSLLWFAFGGYPTRPELCHRHISFSGSPLEGKVPNEVRRMRWRRAESCTKPAPHQSPTAAALISVYIQYTQLFFVVKQNLGLYFPYNPCYTN